MSERENASSDTSSSSESSDSEGEDFSIPDIGSLKPYDHEPIRSSLDEASSSDDKSDNSSDEEQARIGTWWVHNHLGKGVRKVIPSCAVCQIRVTYPSEDGKYIPFMESIEDENRVINRK